jgi:hypothetical protein
MRLVKISILKVIGAIPQTNRIGEGSIGILERGVHEATGTGILGGGI